jgi:hypothetical protein
MDRNGPRSAIGDQLAMNPWKLDFAHSDNMTKVMSLLGEAVNCRIDDVFLSSHLTLRVQFLPMNGSFQDALKIQRELVTKLPSCQGPWQGH